jgi:hypothetical protein
MIWRVAAALFAAMLAASSPAMPQSSPGFVTG